MFLSRRQSAGQKHSGLSNIFERHYQIKIISSKKSKAEHLSAISFRELCLPVREPAFYAPETNELGFTRSFVPARRLPFYIRWGQTAVFKKMIKREKILRFNKKQVRRHLKKDSMIRCLPFCAHRKTLILRLLMSYIYMEHLFLMFLDHTQRRSTVGRTPLNE